MNDKERKSFFFEIVSKFRCLQLAVHSVHTLKEEKQCKMQIVQYH